MYKSKFCVNMVHLTALFKVLETCPSSSHVKHAVAGIKACSKTNTRILNHIVCIVSEDVMQHFNKNAELETIFRVNSFCKLYHAQCNLLKCTPKVVALPYSHKCLVF